MSADRLFSSPSPRVFTLPPAAPFLTELARGLNEAFPDPEALSRVTVLIPTRRAGRELAEAFTRLSPGAALLPMIRPIGDVDADEPPFEPGELADIAPEAVSPARRRFELASLILQKEKAVGRSMGAGGALALADDLARLLDDLATEDVDDLGALTEQVRANLPAHMQEAAMFLDIVLVAWPERLKEMQRVDPARRRSLILKALAKRWRDNPPADPVIAAGSTGSIPAAAELLSAVASLPQGCIVLPGFARDMDEEGWAAIDDGHPQRAMKTLIETIGIDRKAVQFWPGAEEGRQDAPRARVIAEALRPAEATADWLRRVEDLREAWGADVFETALEGLSVLDAPAPAEEARAIALMLRETLETPGARGVLVTPDRNLSRRVITEMARFGVTVDDSAGQPLSDTPSGAFLIRVLQAALDPGSALAFSALATSPLFSLGEERAPLRGVLGTMERRALRGRRPGHDWDALYEHVRDCAGEDDDRRRRWGGIIEAMATALSPLSALEGAQPIAVWTRALVESAEALARNDEMAGADRLWATDAGENAAQLMREFMEEADALPPVSLHNFTRAVLETARSRLVRPRYGAHPRLQILGPLEARLAEADRVILAGLNEGVWPAAPKSDPFLSRGMRIAAGLSAPEERFGLAAHDFAQLACARDVTLTRSAKVDGAPTVASRWLWRLQTLARGALGERAESALAPAQDYLAFAGALDATAEQTVIRPPEPAPPVEARPRKLSVTQIETWIRDPYSIFARKILKLDKLDPLDRPAGAPERGTAYHAALERWVRSLGDTDILPRDALQRLLAHGQTALSEAGFSENALGIEMKRFERVAQFMVAFEAARREDGFMPAALEALGDLSFDAPAGLFTLTGRADRIDLRPSGALDILDYKTGMPPSAKEVAAGFAPQLPLEAAMAARGAFEDAPSHEPGDLMYVRLSGGRVPGEDKSVVRNPDGDDAGILAEQALERLVKWVAAFDDPRRTYPSQPRVKFVNKWGDYDHLARRKEWASAPGDDAGDGGAS
ncbi:double-strand break repair protein AddB [Oceanicaulis sp. LC35]|uniref:double-strand break repair protein AddB n=1 Tax=Oceanicaulis sp. LC35 TaxID=3349635 RepID=UPI003F83DA98